MAQNFNGYNGLPGNGQNENGYGELTNSLIFPGSLPFQAPFQQLWPSTPGWQPSGQESYNIGNPYQGNMIGNNGYFAAQQDYVAFDDGDDFYNNEDENTPTEQEGGHIATSNGISKQGQLGNNQGIVHDAASVSASQPSQSKPQEQNVSQSNSVSGDRSLSIPANSKETQDKLAALRAKLLSQKRVGGKTPTPESSSTQKLNNANTQASAALSQPLQGVDKVSNGSSVKSEFLAQTDTASSAVPSDHKHDTKSVNKSNAPNGLSVLSPQLSHTSTDIEALLAEARDNTVAKEKNNRNDRIEQDSRNNFPIDIPQAPTHPPIVSPGGSAGLLGGDKSLNGGHASSEVSEQGEIREDPKKSNQPAQVQLKTSSEPVALNEFENKPNVTPKPALQEVSLSHADGNTFKQQPAKINTSLANERKGGPGINSGKPKSPPSARTPSSANLREFREGPQVSDFRDQGDRYSRIRDRFAEASWIAPERRHDYDRARPKEPVARDAYSREPYTRDTRQYESFRPDHRLDPRPDSRQGSRPEYRPDYTKRQSIIEENERAAAEYKRNLQQNRPEGREIVMADVPSTTTKVSSKIPSEVTPKVSPKVSKELSKSSPNGNAAEYFADVNEWLEMTGYHDTTYRKKALARHRKLVQLDKERAELEREAQIEREEQSQLIRAQSVKPRDSVEGMPIHAVIPRTFPSFSMPPPPVPAKDTTEDVGIQIKDMANRGISAALHRVDNGMQVTHDSPILLVPAVKRQHSDDNFESREGRSLDKIPRTNAKDFSTERKVQPQDAATKSAAASFESRISIDNGTYRREYQQRSRSPDDRHRSMSPSSRRASGQELHMGRQLSRGSYGSRNGYSPNRRPSYSRHPSPSQTDSGLAYDDTYDSNPRRHDIYRFDYDSRPSPGYDSYNANQRGGSYQQYQPTGNRGRGRGKGRGGYVNNYRGNNYKTYDDSASR